jgi:hypothetical protein
MIISDIPHMESANEVEINGGKGKHKSIEASINGRKSNLNGAIKAFGQMPGNKTAEDDVYSITVNGKKYGVTSSVSPDVDDVFKMF